MSEGKTIICADCGREFFWSDEEQDFYRQKGLSDPKICPICRARRKAEKLQFQKK
jgi:hypothetical protein